MSALLALLTPRVMIPVFAALAGFVGGWSLQKHLSDGKIAGLELAQSKAETAWAQKVSEAQAAARSREAELQTLIDKQRTEADSALETIREQGRLLAVARSDVGRMRNNLAAYAAGRGAADTITACAHRASRLAALLAEGSGLLEEGRAALAECAVAADERGVKLKACVEGWPR